MPDQMPPPLVEDERTTLLALLQYHRESVVRKVEGVSDAEAARPGVPSGTSLLWLVQHLTRAESIWVLQRFDGRPGEPWSDDVRTDESLADSVAAYRAMWAKVAAVVDAEPDLGALCREMGDRPQVSLRWVLMHLLEETARHAGHADIIRELIDGQTGR
ncbi:MAG: DinB family protein [Acidimicrobiales bacterium]